MMQSAQRPQFEKLWYNSKTTNSSSTSVSDLEKSFSFSGFLVPLLQNRWIVLAYFTCEWWDSNLFILLHTYRAVFSSLKKKKKIKPFCKAMCSVIWPLSVFLASLLGILKSFSKLPYLYTCISSVLKAILFLSIWWMPT